MGIATARSLRAHSSRRTVVVPWGRLGVIAVAAAFLVVAWVQGTEAFSPTSPFSMGTVGLPGREAVRIDEARRVVIDYKGSVVPTVQRLGLQITGPNGATVVITTIDAELSFEEPKADDTGGQAIASFAADAPGDYTVTAWGWTETDGRLAFREPVTHDVTGKIVKIVLIGLLVMLAGYTVTIGLSVLAKQPA